MGVSFFMYVSTVMIVFERSKTEPVSPREWRTVANHELHFVSRKEYETPEFDDGEN